MNSFIIHSTTTRQIARDLGLSLQQQEDDITYQELLTLVANQVAELLDNKPETLFSLLYRLDVDQSQVDEVLNRQSDEPKNVLLAGLIIQRQIKRMETKIKYKQPDIDGWEKF